MATGAHPARSTATCCVPKAAGWGFAEMISTIGVMEESRCAAMIALGVMNGGEDM
jgi:hypothetical protein